MMEGIYFVTSGPTVPENILTFSNSDLKPQKLVAELKSVIKRKLKVKEKNKIHASRTDKGYESFQVFFFLTKLYISLFPFFTRFVKCRGITFTQPVHRDKPPQMGHHYLWGSKQLNLAYSTIYGQYTGETSACCVSSLDIVTVCQKLCVQTMN